MEAFDWNEKREQAAWLVAEDRLTDEQIANQLKIARRTLDYWKQHPEFAARVRDNVETYRQAIRSRGIAIVENRVGALDDRWRLMQRVIEERAAAAEMQVVPGGTTGLLVKQLKMIGRGANAQMVEEFAVDTGLLTELRNHEKQAAQELGQWTERQETKSTVAMNIYDDLPDDELDRRIKEIESREAAAAPPDAA